MSTSGAAPATSASSASAAAAAAAAVTFADLVDRAAGLVAGAAGRGGRRALLGLAGPPGAGKTTLALALVAAVRERAGGDEDAARHVPMDGFHLADVELDRLGRRERKGAPDTFDAAGYAALLARLRAAAGDETVYAPAFDRDLEQPVAGSLPVPAATGLVVTEGNYLLLPEGAWPRARALLDEVWWVQLDDDERTARLRARHQRFGKSAAAAAAWVERVDGANAALVDSTRTGADLVVPGSLRVTGG